MPTLDYWHWMRRLYTAARADAEQYARDNPKRYEQNTARAKHKANASRNAALKRLEELELSETSGELPARSRARSRYKPPEPNAPPAPLDELPLTLRLAFERKAREEEERNAESAY